MKPDRQKQPKNQRPARHRADETEPTVLPGSVPVWLLVLLSLALFSSMVYLDNHAGGFNPLVYNRFTSTNHLAELAPVDPAMKQYLAGMKVYNMPSCVSCHQPTGLGTPGQFPPLAGAEWVVEPDPSRLIHIILDGVTGPIKVKGVDYSNAMPPWRPTLNDEQIAAVATYVRRSWGNNATSVKTEQVAKIRKDTETRSQPWTAEELLKLPVGAN
jgi:mono/diheme cytochrome c family protein